MSNIEPQSPFYNVMPEADGKHMVPPRKVNASAADGVFGTPTTNTAPQTKITMGKPYSRFGFLKKRTFLGPLIILVILAIGGGIWMFLNKNKEDIKPITINSEDIEPAGDPEVTTPAKWLADYFGSETCTVKSQCGDKADPDRDGLTNIEEHTEGTDPNNRDSDTDGVADGDEVHIFGMEPLLSRTFQAGQYTDADFVKGGFDINSNAPYTPEQLDAIKTKIKERGLHTPTLTTLGPLSMSLYDFKDPEAQSLESMGVDVSPQAKLDRDTQRQSTIKKIGGALIKYKEAKKSYPLTSDFVEMVDEILPYNTVATNSNDPINKDQYVYSYAPVASGEDFTLSYFSETQNQLIKYTAKNAEETAAKENSQINNDQRIADLENVKSALMIYSSANADSNSSQINVFPAKDQFPSALIPRYISAMPADPNGQAYVYEVSANFETFTLKAAFENPPAGVTGYMCNQEECKNY